MSVSKNGFCSLGLGSDNQNGQLWEEGFNYRGQGLAKCHFELVPLQIHCY